MLVTKVFVDQLQCIDFGIFPTRQRESSGNCLVALLKSGSTAGIDPEYVGIWMQILERIAVLDSDLRFPNSESELRPLGVQRLNGT